ncbi:MAG: hypothetical protein M0Z61_13980 [Nitrospiraceae bacterium]|nr:hypothetical protein [Nitrospiraceae bacterium]
MHGRAGNRANRKGLKFIKRSVALFGAALLCSVFCGQAGAYGLTVYYLFKLANFSGGIPYSFGTRLAVDGYTGEVYVISDDTVSIFNSAGMQTYQFGEAGNLGVISDLAVDKDGNILTLSYGRGDNRYFIGFCNYRGELKRKIMVTNLPPSFSIFEPGKLFIKGGHLYLADLSHLLVAQVDEKGVCLRTWDLFHTMGWDKIKDKSGNFMKAGDVGAFGFTMDDAGNMYLTIPTSFRAYKVTPDGKVKGFGVGGSGAGKFGVASGIAVDDKGYIYVTDRLRCAVLIFDKDLNFAREFGYRGYGMGGLIVPTEVAVAKDGTLYVSQGANRGVDVFKMGYD